MQRRLAHAPRYTILRLHAILLVCLFSVNGIGRAAEPGNTVSPLRITTASFPSEVPGRSRLRVFLGAPYSALQFVRTDSGFVADFELTVSIEGAPGTTQSRTSTHLVHATSFEGTTARDHAFTSLEDFPIPPGEYTVQVEIRNPQAGTTTGHTAPVIVREIVGPGLGVSDLMVTIGSTENLQVVGYQPEHNTITATYGDRLLAVFETVAADSMPNPMLHWSVAPYHRREQPVAERQTPLQASRRIVAHELVIDPHIVPAGPYVFRLTVSSGETSVSHDQTFSLRWQGFPFEQRDLARAAAQATYVLDAATRRRLETTSGSEQAGLLAEVWRREARAWNTFYNLARDDNPARREYYARADYADQMFWDAESEGWRTERGKCFLLNGPPDRITRNEHHPDLPPHEIWEYEALNKRYTFMDRNRRGIFKLSSMEPLR